MRTPGRSHRLSLTRARRAAVVAQSLGGDRPSSVVEAVDRLGRLQIDPTNAVARAERLVLWSRLGAYDIADLRRAAYVDRELFEYWAFYLPTADYPVYREVMRTWPAGEHAEARRFREFAASNVDFRRYVLDELRRRGPLRSRDLEDRAAVPWRSGGWSDGRSLDRMLEYLLMSGAVAVSGRDGGQRVWDLAGRCHPTDAPEVPPRELTRRLLDRQLRAHGVARPNGFGWQFGHRRPAHHAEVLDGMVRAGVAVPVEIDGLAGPWYAHAAVLDAEFTPRTTLLCPFDRLIHDRARAEELFGFAYRLEMYVPVARRVYGYYVLPVLDGDRLVGRADVAMDRRAGRLEVKGVWAEPDAPGGTGERLAAALADLAGWLGAAEIRGSGPVPRAWAGALDR